MSTLNDGRAAISERDADELVSFDDYIYIPRDRHAKLMIAESGFPAFLGTRPFWGQPIPTMRAGDTGVGFTLEQLLGVQENNAAMADLYGWEVKSTGSSQAQITLFTKNPTTPHRAVHILVDRFGSPCGQDKKLNTNLAAGRTTRLIDTRVTLEYSAADDLRVVTDDREVLASWSVEEMQAATAKLTNLMLCTAANHHLDGTEHFTFVGYELHCGFNYSAFVDCLRSGKISIHFRVKGTLSKARNRGAAFRMKSSDIKLLYNHHTLWP